MKYVQKLINKVNNSTLSRAAGFYTLTNVLSAAIPFLLMPILTRHLSPEDYGITTMVQLLTGFLAPFVGVNVQGAISVKYFQQDSIDFPKYVSSCLLILWGTVVCTCLIFWMFQYSIAQISEIPADWIWSVIVLCLGQFIIAIILIILQSSIQPKLYGIIQVSQTIMNFCLTVGLVVFLHFNWQGRIIAQLVTVIFFAIFSVWLLYYKGWLVFDYDLTYMKDALKFGLPLIPHMLAGSIMGMADRFIITQNTGLSDAGIYTVGLQMGMVIGLFQDSFNLAYAPWLYDKLSHITNEVKVKIVKFTYIYMIGIIIVAILYSVCMPWVLKYFVGKQFYAAKDVILWIALGYAFGGMYKMVVNYIFYVEKTYLLAGITFTSSIFHIIITYYGVQYYGSLGAAYATTLTFLLTFLLTWLLSSRVYPMPWKDVFLRRQ